MVSDIGQIGWYSNSTILDEAGLVNGSASAKVSETDRPCFLSKKMGYPDYLILLDEQVDVFSLNQGGNIVLKCDATTGFVYTKTTTKVYGLHTLSSDRSWYLWTKLN
jgi:hypothetical protein